jgi:electron transfer flavoprotein beta subunit
LRKALAMGAHRVVQVADAALAGADLTLTATTLAAVLRKVEADLIITGNVSTDGSGGVIPSMVAEHLGLPSVTALDKAEIVAGEGGGVGVIRGERTVDGAKLGVELALPAVVSITEQMPDPRFASLKGIMAAKKKPFDVHSLAELGVDADELVPRSIMTAAAEQPPRGAGIKIEDDGTAAAQLTDFLAQKGLL